MKKWMNPLLVVGLACMLTGAALWRIWYIDYEAIRFAPHGQGTAALAFFYISHGTQSFLFAFLIGAGLMAWCVGILCLKR